MSRQTNEQRLKIISLILALIGISILIILFSSNATNINSSNISSLEENQKIVARGLVIKERVYGSSKLYTLDNSLEISCDGYCPSFLNKTVAFEGLIDIYQNKTTIVALKISQ